MSILAKIFDKIFPWADADAPSLAPPGLTQSSQDTAATQSSSPTSTPQTQISSSISGKVDVEKVLTDLASKSGQASNWRTSIVDLLKLLDLDSSLQARKELAQELDYPGDTNDSTTLNIWLHKELMKTLAANGGKIPEDLKD